MAHNNPEAAFEWCRECYCYHNPAGHVDMAVIAKNKERLAAAGRAAVADLMNDEI